MKSNKENQFWAGVQQRRDAPPSWEKKFNAALNAPGESVPDVDRSAPYMSTAALINLRQFTRKR